MPDKVYRILADSEPAVDILEVHVTPEAEEELLSAKGLTWQDVSYNERSLRVIFGFIVAVLTTGVVLGLSPVTSVLVHEGAFHNLCPEGTPDDVTCQQQHAEFVDIFTVATSAFNLMSVVAGRLVDVYGPRLAMHIGGFLFASGAFIVGNTPDFFFQLDGYMIGFLLLGCGGPFIFLSMLHLSNLFPLHSGAVTAMFVASLEGSCIVMATFNLLYFSGIGATHQEMFLLYSAVVVLMTIMYWHPVKKVSSPTLFVVLCMYIYVCVVCVISNDDKMPPQA
jgi:MFS family permease